jgi:hypothetical protein
MGHGPLRGWNIGRCASDVDPRLPLAEQGHQIGQYQGVTLTSHGGVRVTGHGDTRVTIT